MRIRITVLIPALLVFSTLAGGLWMFEASITTASDSIRSEFLGQSNLDMTRLQNILYNRLTANELEEARLNLSVTAMDTTIRSLIVSDEHDIVLMANRYTWEGSPASQVSGYRPDLAAQIRASNRPRVNYSREDDSLLQGYYPIILQLQSQQGLPVKRVGTLFVESSIAAKLAAARRAAAQQSLLFSGLMLLATAIVAVMLHFLVSTRLQRLSLASTALAAGHFDTKVAIGGRDELAALGQSFDNMAQRIQADIQRRQRAEDELRRLNDTLEQRVAERTEQLSEAQRIGQMGHWFRDPTSDTLYWSDELFRIYGYQPNEIVPTDVHFRDAIVADDLDQFDTSQQQAIETGQRQSIDHRITLPDGSLRWVHQEIVVQRDGSGRKLASAGTVQDITARKEVERHLQKAKEEAERANQAKSEFLSRMSHELRTPLNAILGFSQVMALEVQDEVHSSYVTHILQAGEHLLSLIEELLDLSRIESGRLTIALSNIDLQTILRQSVDIIRPAMLARSITLEQHCDNHQRLIADSTRLKQVLVNLLSNAVKYNRTGGRITINCISTAQGQVRIAIADTGNGISPEHYQRLFKPFERLESDYSGIDGSGIGLALSKQLVELMGGHIGFESTPGQGSVFWLEFPLTGSTKEGTEQVPPPPEALRAASTVLYIEDNMANLAVVQAMLKKHPGLTLITANNGEYGVELARRYQPAKILLDIHLPDLDGYTVLKTLQTLEETRHIPVIALSADAMPLDVERGLQAGFVEYLTKPVKYEALLQAIDA